MHTVVVIEKYSKKSFLWQNLLKHKQLKNLSFEQILNKYEGIEGKVVAFFNFEDIKHGFRELINKHKELEDFNNWRLLHVFSDRYEIPSSIKTKAIKEGYDVGVCEEETAFSSIFHESLFGNLSELVAFKDFLNSQLLFEDQSLAEKYVSIHNALSKQGKDVEDYINMNIYEIWKQDLESLTRY